MKTLYTVLLILILFPQMAFTKSYKLKATNYYSMLSSLDTRVVELNGDDIKLKVFELANKEKSPYPIGSEFVGKITKKKAPKRFYRDEYWMVQISKVVYPDGSIKNDDLKFKIHPRPFINSERIVVSAVDVAAFTLGVVFDATIVGLPVSRGGYGILYSSLEVKHRKENTSKTKAAIVGFAKGLVFPIPQLLAKGKDLEKLTLGSHIYIAKEGRGKSIDAYLRV